MSPIHYVSYEEASAWYQAEGVTTQAELKARAKQGMPSGIPYNPARIYPEEFKDGGLGRFLGTGRIAPQNREFASYEEASQWYQAEGVTTQSELKVRAKQGVPSRIPASPAQVYREEFKDGGYGRFLGTGRIAVSNREFASYKEASEWYQAEGVTTRDELTARAKQGVPSRIPASPARVYREEFKDGGYGRFLGTGRIAPQNREFASYEEASLWYQAEGVTTYAEMQARAKQGVPSRIPSDPAKVYSEQWQRDGLTGFLALKKMAGASPSERALRHVLEQMFDEVHSQARLRVAGVSGQSWQVDSCLVQARLIVEYDGSRWHHAEAKMALDSRKTDDLVAAGWTVVRVRGQTSRHRLPLLRSDWDVAVNEEAPLKDRLGQVVVHLQALVTSGRWAVATTVYDRVMAWSPDAWADLNFREVLTAYDGWVSYEEASEWYQAEGVTTQHGLQSRTKQGVPPRIPSDPAKVYREEFKAGGYGRFLGTGRIASQDREFASYEEASLWYQAEGVTTYAEMQARAKQGLPSRIPANPAHVYREEFKAGGYGRFLGTGRIAVFNREFASYEEASEWYQAEGVTTQHGLQSRTKQGVPPRIPSNPAKVYREEFKDGGLGRFLGTGRIASQDREFASYEEASQWYQAERVTTRAELNARAKQGVPSRIPSDPAWVYREEFKDGGYGRFLGTGRIAHKNREFASYEEASLWYQTEGVTTKAELNARAKQGVPSRIPSDPAKVYREEFKDGGLGRFLGTGRIAPKNREFASYEEASLWYQAEGVTTRAKLQARAKQGVPSRIPSDPAWVYREEFKDGGYGRFLGTEPKAPTSVTPTPAMPSTGPTPEPRLVASPMPTPAPPPPSPPTPRPARRRMR